MISDTELRITALSFALQYEELTTSSKGVIGVAEEFYKFLKNNG